MNYLDEYTRLKAHDGSFIRLKFFKYSLERKCSGGSRVKTIMLKYHTGMEVVVSLDATETYIGQISLIATSYIEILQAVHLRTSATLDLKIYKSDITFIELLKSQQTVNEVFCDFTHQELLGVSKMLSNNTFIERFDVVYHDAIAEIESEAFIGFHMPGTERGRFSDDSLIAISTSKNIYLFDIVSQGRIETALKNILEANVPKKIIHNACNVADYLKHHHKINLGGVFDTMVAHCSLGFAKNRSSLPECLLDHFNLPEEFVDTLHEGWHRRPLSLKHKRAAGQNVVFLKKFHSKLSRIMLKDVYVQSEQNPQ